MSTPRASSKRKRRIRVLVVDDSAVVRQVMQEVLDADPAIQVTVAADPIIAQRKMAKQRPDVIVLDLEMPRMDGMTFLQTVMTTDPIPVVVCSGHVGKHSEKALMALERGAVDLVAKPELGIREFVYDSALKLRNTVKAAALAQVRPRSPVTGKPVRKEPAPPPATHIPKTLARLSVSVDKIVAVGASTGGPEALTALLSSLPEGSPAMVIVQHMPAGFTKAFAQRLDTLSRLQVKEAEAGDVVERGVALVAPGDHHLTIQRRGGRVVAQIEDGPLVSGHRPSVDVLFRSVAETAQSRAIGVLLTGMGADGAQGLLAMKQAGAHTVAQDEATSVIFGMPNKAIQLGAVDEVLPLPQIAAHVLRRSCAYRPGEDAK